MRLSASLFLAITMSVVGAGCGSGGRSGAATTTTAPPAMTAAATTTSGAGALQAEADATAAGDIPDNQELRSLYREPKVTQPIPQRSPRP